MFPKPLRWLLDAMAAVGSETYTSTSAPIQHAAVTAFRGGEEIERYLADCRRVLGALGRACHERLVAAGVAMRPPEGAFYLFPDFRPLEARLRARGIQTSDALCERLLEATGVAMLPGSHFGRAPEELTARIAYVNFDGERALAGVPREGTVGESFLRDHCAATLEAIDRLCDWLS
jgi:aspartate aminotransferase